MDARLRSPLERLGGRDSGEGRALDLPHGTEVVTRVERVMGERRVARGAIGRVMKTHEDALDVAIVGVGTIRYGKDEVDARRVGQAAFARRRQLAWDALSPTIVVEAVVGSRAWGLAHAGSDEDRRGVFALPFAWTSGIVAPPEDLVSADGSSTYWSVGKCVLQALRADPNTLETLFVESVTARDPIGQMVIDARDAFVSKEIYGTFGRYAMAQLRRLEQSARLHAHRRDVIRWLAAEPTLSMDAAADRLADRSPQVWPTRREAVLQCKQWLKQLYRSLHDRGLLGACDWASLGAYATSGPGDDLEASRELSPKNAYNLLRLIDAATRWLAEGRPRLRVEGPLRERLLAIKGGDVSLAEVVGEAEAMLPALEAARDASPLPERPDVARADRLMRAVSEEVARRHLERRSGPWAAGVLDPPEAEWRG